MSFRQLFILTFFTKTHFTAQYSPLACAHLRLPLTNTTDKPRRQSSHSQDGFFLVNAKAMRCYSYSLVMSAIENFHTQSLKRVNRHFTVPFLHWVLPSNTVCINQHSTCFLFKSFFTLKQTIITLKQAVVIQKRSRDFF